MSSVEYYPAEANAKEETLNNILIECEEAISYGLSLLDSCHAQLTGPRPTDIHAGNSPPADMQTSVFDRARRMRSAANRLRDDAQRLLRII